MTAPAGTITFDIHFWCNVCRASVGTLSRVGHTDPRSSVPRAMQTHILNEHAALLTEGDRRALRARLDLFGYVHPRASAKPPVLSLPGDDGAIPSSPSTGKEPRP